MSDATLMKVPAMFYSMGGLWGGVESRLYPMPVMTSFVHETKGGIPYLKEAGVAMVARPEVDLTGVREFLVGFDPSLGFSTYLDDELSKERGAHLVKLAGQLCYMSFGPNRTKNVEIKKYLQHIKESGHGSVLEHVSYVFLIWGISRSVTHELVRHRVGIGYSQVSQRYVDGKVLRFVKRPEFEGDDELSERFESWIANSAREYDSRAASLARRFSSDQDFASLSKTDQRKRVNQAARSCLPNETEAPIIVSANVRTWRHLSEMRVSEPAEIEIRRAFFKVFLCLAMVEPSLFEDYEIIDLKNGTYAVKTPHRKV